MPKCEFDCPLFDSKAIGVVCPSSDFNDKTNALNYCDQIAEFRSTEKPTRNPTQRRLIDHEGNHPLNPPRSVSTTSVRFSTE